MYRDTRCSCSHTSHLHLDPRQARGLKSTVSLVRSNNTMLHRMDSKLSLHAEAMDQLKGVVQVGGTMSCCAGSWGPGVSRRRGGVRVPGV